MARLIQEICLSAASWQTLLAVLIPAAYLCAKYLRKREEKFYEAIYRRERITRRLMEG